MPERPMTITVSGPNVPGGEVTVKLASVIIMGARVPITPDSVAEAGVTPNQFYSHGHGTDIEMAFLLVALEHIVKDHGKEFIGLFRSLRDEYRKGNMSMSISDGYTARE